ncbi:MAG: hypothetical protein ACK4Q5_03315 [Saprospiraceae bacterium]
MRQIVITIEEGYFRQFLQFLKTLNYVKSIQPRPAETGGSGNRFDFSDLAGTLEWRGDAVAQQRILRDEW